MPSESSDRLSVSLLCVELDYKGDLEALPKDQAALLAEIARVAGRHGGRDGAMQAGVFRVVFSVPHSRMPAYDAVAAAESLKEVFARTPLPITWRAAVATATSITQGDVVYGDAMSIARDLLNRAVDGSIEIDPETQRLAAAWGGSGRRELLGRDPELATIERSLDSIAADGRCHRLLIAAEPGVGKSAVVEEVITRTTSRARIAVGQCQPWGIEALGPLAEATAGLLDRSSPDEDLIAALSRSLTHPDKEVIVRQVADLFGWGQERDSNEMSFWGVRHLLEEMAGQRPLLLVLEDLHWADEALLSAIEDFTLRGAAPILILATCRPEFLATRPDLALESPNSHVMKLGPLERSNAIAVLEASLGGSLSAGDWLDRLLDAAGGNPLFLSEMSAHLRDTGKLVQQNGTWTAPDGAALSLAPSIEALLGARVVSLPQEERGVIEAATIWGTDFTLEQLHALLPDTVESDLFARLARLQAKDFIETEIAQTGGDFIVRHALIRDAVYELCPKERRAALHRLAATFADEAGLADAFSGFHFEQAFKQLQGSGSMDEDVLMLAEQGSVKLAEAGKSERGRGSYTSAVDLLARAVDLRVERDASWVNNSIELSEVLFELGQHDRLRTTVDQILSEAGSLSDPRLLARVGLLEAWRAVSVDSSIDPEWEEKLRQLTPAFEHDEDHTGLVKVYRTLGEWFWMKYLAGDAGRMWQKALEHSLLSPRKRDLVRCVGALGAAAVWGPMPVGEGMALCDHLMEVSINDRFAGTRTDMRTAVLLALRGDFANARRRMRAAHATLIEEGHDFASATNTQNSGLIELLAGDLNAAYAEFKRGFDALTALGEEDFRAQNAVYLARALFGLGRVDEAVTMLDDADSVDPLLKLETDPVRACVEADRGHLDEAVRLIESARSRAKATDWSTLTAQTEVLAARAFAKLGLASEEQAAWAAARDICARKEAPALLGLTC